MPRFFVRDDQISQIDGETTVVTITGSDALHISRSLRMREGEEITICDLHRRDYLCRLTAFTADTVSAEVISSQPSRSEPPFDITLFMALPKSDKMEWIIQKSVECGVAAVVPFASERSVVKLGEKDGEKKRDRWQKISDAAAGQCGRGILPAVKAPISYGEALRQADEILREGGLCFLCYEGEEHKEKTLPKILKGFAEASESPREKPLKIGFFVGSEGGFSLAEVEKATAAGIPSVGLGPRILRCETAPIFVLSCLSYAFEL